MYFKVPAGCIVSVLRYRVDFMSKSSFYFKNFLFQELVCEPYQMGPVTHTFSHSYSCHSLIVSNEQPPELLSFLGINTLTAVISCST